MSPIICQVNIHTYVYMCIYIFLYTYICVLFLKESGEQKLFEWCDGPLVEAMRNGAMFLIDEISLADDSVLERLNSVLEMERILVLSERGEVSGTEGTIDVIKASEKFRLLATMNPGGDFGKKEVCYSNLVLILKYYFFNQNMLHLQLFCFVVVC